MHGDRFRLREVLPLAPHPSEHGSCLSSEVLASGGWRPAGAQPRSTAHIVAESVAA